MTTMTPLHVDAVKVSLLGDVVTGFSIQETRIEDVRIHRIILPRGRWILILPRLLLLLIHLLNPRIQMTPPCHQKILLEDVVVKIQESGDVHIPDEPINANMLREDLICTKN
ncbi:hypothetical protein CRE_31350 [Caenorhabditis remanei]|uniref:Uncharacterized protein n=1 Tax=Caenorhabditis remanei TaxID=31234 RepID=E3MYB7_CAERE|nr:hypothetical protein CRE_31350 [Caenorhabditis remanei]